MDMRRLFYIAIFFLFSAVSCKDDKPKPYCEENPSECQSVLEAKKFFAFKVGSWWVYEEETSGQRDSLYVTEGNNDYTSYDFDTRIESALTGYEYHYWPLYVGTSKCNASQPVNAKCIFINRSKAKPGDYIGESQCFFVSYGLGDYATTGSDLTYCINNKIIVSGIYANYNLQNYNMGKTIKINEICTYIEGKQPTNHFYSEHVGLIRKELLDSNQVWNLVDYYIMP